MTDDEFFILATVFIGYWVVVIVLLLWIYGFL